MSARITLKNNPYARIEYFFIIIALFLLMAFLFRKSQDDIAFCRDTIFGNLVRGRQTASGLIVWGEFQAVGMDVGETYRNLPNTKERQAYEKAFVRSFAEGFKQGRTSPSDFKNWRVFKHSDNLAVIAADYPKRNRTLLFALIKSGSDRKLISLAWQEEE